MKKLFLIPLIVVFTVFFIQKNVDAKSYSYPDITIYLDLDKDGTITVRQERTYDFQGSFTWAYLDLLKKSADDIKFVDIKDMETNQTVRYDLEDDSKHTKATWYYSANYEWKKFLIVYQIYGAVDRYQDVAEFYWKVIEDEHEFIKDFNAVITLPEASPDLLKLFVHSLAKPGEMRFSEDYKQVTVIMHDIPKDSFVEFRLLTDPSIFREVRLEDKKMYENILNEEKFNLFTDTILFYILLIIPPIGIFFYYYWKYGREPKVEYDLTYEREPPRKIPPMALAVLMKSKLGDESTKGFIATIFDLARRGYLQIREEIKPHFLMFEKKDQRFILTRKGKKELKKRSKLLNFEINVLRFLFQLVPSKKSTKNLFTLPKILSKDLTNIDLEIKTDKIYPEITASEIVKWNRKNRITLSLIEILKSNAQYWFESKFFSIYTKRSKIEGRNFAKLLILYFVGIVALLYFLGRVSLQEIVLLLLITFLFMVVGIIPILRKTPEATLEIKKWQAFKRYISDFSAMKDAPPVLLHIWDEYLVYAVLLGVAKKLLENLKKLAERYNWKFDAVTWYAAVGAARIPSGTMSPESFSSLVGNMSNMVTALSSTSSVGGGFAGGGGGGGGGGGSGAG